MRIELALHLRTEDEGMRRQGIMEVVVDIRGVPGESYIRRAKEDIGGTDHINPLNPLDLLVLGGLMADITFVQLEDHPFQPPLSINHPT
jgi:hypothetical protein